MLGDIYTMPIAGGVATPLISGVAWQTQPRFSPDGKYVIYTSDESGCDNIWVYSMDRQKSMQVTYEPFFYVSNAQWKDGHTIVANKWHLVLDRGIAGAEIWEYAVPQNWDKPLAWGDHWDKVKGKLIAARTNDYAQFGPEEPFVSSGYTYFSRNMIDTRQWNYNKDPHAGIYAILRVSNSDSSDGPEYVTGGPGGAARPVLSPDGKILAFIRRTLFTTSLMLRDLESGNEKQIFDLAYQDQQEAYAPCGVYPSFAFLDQNNIVAWGGGKIWKVPLPASIDDPASLPSAPSSIPFTVNVQRAVAPVVRSQHDPKQGWDASTNTFKSHVAMHASANPSGQKVTFSTLGDIYTADVDKNRVLSVPTKVVGVGAFNAYPADSLYYWPSYDFQGKQLVRTGWNDIQYGWVEVLPHGSQVATKVSAQPGRYLKPTFNQLGDRVLYARAGGDDATGERYSVNAGIYITDLDKNGVPIPGRTAQFVTDGEWAEYDFSTSTDPKNARALVIKSPSYPLTVDRVSLAPTSLGRLDVNFCTAQYALSIAFSRDLKLVAFVEFEVVYVQLVPTGLAKDKYPFEVTARIDNMKKDSRTQIISKAGGDFLSFSKGHLLSFGWGSSVTTVDLSKMAAPGFKCPDQLCFFNKVNAEARVYPLALDVPAGTATETLVVFDHATVIPMDTRYVQQVLTDQRIVVKGDTIVTIGDSASTPTPQGATVIDLQGATVLPGFLDVHAHWGSASTQRWGKSKQGWEFLANLAFGVTTLHNPSAEFWSVFSDAELIRSGKKIGPRIFSTGSVMFGGGGDLHCDVPSVEAAQEALARRAAFGGFSVKSYMIQCRAGRQKVLQAARNMNMEVVPEGGMHFAWDLSYIVDGHTTVEHSLPMAPFYKDVIQLFGGAQTAWTPTMVVSFGGLFGEHFFYQNSSVFLDPTVQQWVPNNDIRPTAMRRIEADHKDYHVFNIAKAAADVAATGTNVNVGAHGQMQGIGYLWEVKFMQAGGMSNYDAIKTATINPARSLGLDAKLGSLYAGKLADLVILNSGAQPLSNIDDLRNIKYVMTDGKLYDVSDFSRVLPTTAPAPVLTVINTPAV